MCDYINRNRCLWDARVASHWESDFYNVDEFLNGASSLKTIERDLLAPVSGKSILHLQCHFGLDTLSLARMGAAVTGVDFSGKAVKYARELAQKTGLQARFIQCDVYETADKLSEKFDIVFTSYGVLGWLPDMQRWAQTVETFLKPGGVLVLVEFHPLIWMFNPAFTAIEYSYFNRGPIVEKEIGSYADPKKQSSGTSVSWNHTLSDVQNALMEQRLNICRFDEYDYSPYNCFSDMIESEKGQYQIRSLQGKLPLIYALKAQKPNR